MSIWYCKIEYTVVVVVADAPIVLSLPHFYQADTSYQHAVDGLTPNDSYVTYLNVEPVCIQSEVCECGQPTVIATECQLSTVHLSVS